MKFLWLSLAVIAFSVVSLFNAPAAFNRGPEQAVIAAVRSPEAEAWLAVIAGAFEPVFEANGPRALFAD